MRTFKGSEKARLVFARADAGMTAYLWLRMINDIRGSFGMREIPFRLMQQLAKVPRKKVHDFFLNRVHP